MALGLAACGGGSGGGGGGSVPELNAEAPADLTDPVEVAKRYLLLVDEIDATPDEFAELRAVIDDLLANIPDEDFDDDCADGGTLSLRVDEIADRPNPFSGDEFNLDIFTLSNCRFGDDFGDGLLEAGNRTDGVDPTLYVGMGESADNQTEVEEGPTRYLVYARLFDRVESDVEQIGGEMLSREEIPSQNTAAQIDLLGLGGTGFFQLEFNDSVTPSTITGEGRVRVDRVAGDDSCGAPGMFDFQVTQDIELDSGGTPMAGEIEFDIDGNTATVEVAGGGIVVTIGTESTGFDPADLAALQPDVDVCFSDT